MPRCSGPSSLMVDGAGGLTFFLLGSAHRPSHGKLSASRREQKCLHYGSAMRGTRRRVIVFRLEPGATLMMTTNGRRAGPPLSERGTISHSQSVSLLQEGPSDDLRVTAHRSVQTLQQQWRRVEQHREVADVSYAYKSPSSGRRHRNAGRKESVKASEEQCTRAVQLL